MRKIVIIFYLLTDLLTTTNQTNNMTKKINVISCKWTFVSSLSRLATYRSVNDVKK